MTTLSLVARTARLTVLKDLVTALDFYAGTPPAKPEDAPGSTLLAHMDTATPVGTMSQDGDQVVLTLTAPLTTNCVASGVVGWVRIPGVMDLVVGTEGSGAPVLLSALQVYTGGELQLLSCELRE